MACADVAGASRELGLDPQGAPARRAAELTATNVTWHWWHYDVLRALDYMGAAGMEDPRAAEAVALVMRKQDADGRWLLELRHDDALDFDMGEQVGQPSRWITLRAMRVLSG